MTLINPYKRTDLEPRAGRLLIAEPFMSDNNFSRTVIYLCDYGPEGSVGFAINRRTELTLADLLADLYAEDLSVYHGGPVQVDTLHILHRIPHLLGGTEVAPGIYWGGAYDALQDVVQGKMYEEGDMRVLVGYAGWAPDQLKKEIEEKSWIVAEATQKLIFETPSNALWRKAIESIGHEFAFLAHLPLSPQLN